MNTATGQIVSLKSDYASIEVSASDLCARCAEGRGCGAALIGSGSAQATIDVDLPVGRTFCVGDSVIIGLESSSLLRASWLAYGLPLTGALLFVGIGWLTRRSFGDWSAAGLALVGLATGWLFSRVQLKNSQCMRRFRPVLRGSAQPDAAHDI